MGSPVPEIYLSTIQTYKNGHIYAINVVQEFVMKNVVLMNSPVPEVRGPY